MDVIDIVYEKLLLKMCVLCRRLLSFLHDCYNTKNHLCMLKLSHKVTKVRVLLLKCAIKLKSLETYIL